MPDRAKLAKEWFVRGDHDLQSARLLLNQGGPTDTIGVLIQQATEKYLKGYLIYNGWKLKKTHDLRGLIAEAVDYDPGFTDYQDFARKATAHYLENRYPPTLPVEYPREEMAAMLEQAEKLVARIKEATH